MMDRAELAAWLSLLDRPGLGNVTLRRLLAAFGTPEAVLAASPVAWREAAGPRVADALAAATTPDTTEARLATALAWLAGGPGGTRHALALGDARYPPALLQTADPPLLLFAEGDLSLLRRPALAVVGSRHATPQGLDHAQQFAAHLSRAGLTIVSGLALGIDGAAHEGALAGAGSTIAVIGTGPDQIYPRRHAALTRRIAEQGLVLSEFAPGVPAMAPNFPRRNRIIAGLALGTLVVEAAPQSGSLITARLALDCNREVFAIPGSIHSPQSRGCHHLIKQGAKLVESAEDILSELRRPGPLPWATPAEPGEAPDEDDDPDGSAADPVLRALGHDPMSLDSLCARTGWPPGELTARLLDLELGGQVSRLPGGLFQRRACG